MDAVDTTPPAAVPIEQIAAPAEGFWRRERLPLAAIVALAALLPAHRVWAADVLLVMIALVLPGVLLLRLVRLPETSQDLLALYIPAGSLFMLMAAGLAIDLVGPRIGIPRPLRGDATALIAITSCVLLWLAGIRREPSTRTRIGSLPFSLRGAALLLLPLLSAAGALAFNGGHGSVLARTMAVAIPVALGIGLICARRLSKTEMAVLIFSCALAAEWAFSLRSQEILGFDISTELGVAERTQLAGIWHATHHNDAYGAMLSVGVLPSVLTSLAGLSPLIVMKALYPVLAALLPVGVFLVADRHLRRGYAGGAAALIVQYYFFQQLTELARQEVALLFFTALIAAILDARGRLRASLPLIGVFALGLVVSHYSSTYVALLLLPITLIVEVLVSRRNAARGIALGLLAAFVILATGATVWYGAVTHSASNFTSFVSSVRNEGLNLFPSTHGSGINAYFYENQVTSIDAAQYEARAVSEYRSRPYVHPLRASNNPGFRLRDASAPAPASQLHPLEVILSVIWIVGTELILVFVGLGTLAVTFRRDGAMRPFGVLALGAIGMLVLFRFSGTLAGSYNQTRALLQSLIVLSLPAAFAAQWLTDRLRRLPVGAAFAAVLALVFAWNDGATTLAVGGSRSFNIAGSGEDFERYYTTPAELAGARFAADQSKNIDLYADRYGQLRLSETTGAVALGEVTPRTLDARAWVYGTRTNILAGRARDQLGSSAVTFQWPATFLETYYDTVFDDGGSQVFHR